MTDSPPKRPPRARQASMRRLHPKIVGGGHRAGVQLDAQREACEAYVTSQKHEGWAALSALYDDGAYSGGTMERAHALQWMLDDIRAREIDVVVVYKVDRMTRSLPDFAKIVEVCFSGSHSSTDGGSRYLVSPIAHTEIAHVIQLPPVVEPPDRPERAGSRRTDQARCSLPSLRRILWRKNMPQTRATSRIAQGPWSALQTILGRARQQYPVHPRSRKSLGEIIRKLSVTESQNSAHLLGTWSRRNSRVVSANSPQVP
jgi:Resolvase, N terminal domain